MEFKITKQLFGTSASDETPRDQDESTKTTKPVSSPTTMKITVERDPSKLYFARNMLTLISLMNGVVLCALVTTVLTGLDLVHLFLYKELSFKMRMNGLYIGAGNRQELS